jgi:hypothetical protein
MVMRSAFCLFLFPILCQVNVAVGQIDQLDQYHGIPPSVGHKNANAFSVGFGMESAQTFTVGISGWLSTVNVGLYQPDVAFDGTFTVDISRVVDGTPDFSESGVLARQVLSSSTIPIESVSDIFLPQFTLGLDFLPSHVSVSAGDKLALIIRADKLNWWKNIDFVHSYAGGGFFYYGPNEGGVVNAGGDYYDGMFRTYVLPVPEPPTSSIVYCGILFMCGTARRRT